MIDWPFVITVLSVVCVIGLVLAEQVFRINLWLYRNWGWSNLADRWEKRKSWWIVVSRVVLGAIAIAGLTALHLWK